MRATPPARAQRWLERWLPESERVELLGDLNEDFAAYVGAHGLARARRWYWRQTLSLLAHRRRLELATRTAHGTSGPGLWADWHNDLRYGLRSLRNAPIFASVSILSLVISLGLSTAVLSIATTVLFEPLPVATADRVVRLGLEEMGTPPPAQSVGAAAAPRRLADVLLGVWQAETRTLEAISMYDVQPQTVTLGDEVLRVEVASVTGSFFDILPVRPAAGRTLQAHDWPLTAAKVAVVSARLVGPRAADLDALVGDRLAIDGVTHQIVGVLPADFEWPSASADVWVVDRWRPPPPGTTRQMFRSPLVLGLMRPGVSVAEVTLEGQAHAEGLVASGARVSLLSTAAPTVVVDRLKDELLRPVRPALWLLVGGTVGVLIAANVTLIGFLVSRNVARRRDLAVRRALGATGWRQVRPLLAEQFWIVACGLGGGLALAWLVLRLLPVVAPPDLPRLSAVALDGWSLAFGAGVALTSAIVIGLVPAWDLSRISLRAAVADSGLTVVGAPSTDRMRSRLVVAQVALATMLVAGSVMVGRSLLTMLRVDLGYQPTGVLTFQVGTTDSLRSMPGRLTSVYATLFERLRQVPTVISVGASTTLPLHGQPSGSYQLPRPGSAQTTTLYQQREHITPDYLQTLGAVLTAGRFFNERDRADSPKVAIVNTLYAQTFLPGLDPLGQIAPYGVHKPEIVGIIAPIARAAVTDPRYPVMYLPSAQTIEAVAFSAGRGMGVAVRTSGDPLTIAPYIRAIVSEAAPGTPVHNLMPLDRRVHLTYSQPRFFALALVLFAALALGTTVLGVYGTLAASVERRRVELGLRRALGATPRDLSALVVGRALRLAVLGLAFGLAIAVVGATGGRSVLFGMTPADTVSYLVTVPGILVVVLLGAWVPLRTALRIDPARVLRAE